MVYQSNLTLILAYTVRAAETMDGTGEMAARSTETPGQDLGARCFDADRQYRRKVLLTAVFYLQLFTLVCVTLATILI